MVAIALVTVACTSSADSADLGSSTTTAPRSTVPPTTIATTTRAPSEPQGGVRVIRPNWDSALVSSSVVMVLLELAGYEVDEFESRSGVTPDYLYGRLALGEADLTLDVWPNHTGWIEGGGPLGPVGDLVTVIESPHQPDGGVQGFLITKSWADEYDITHLGQINDDPNLAVVLDLDDDGLGEIYGCPEEWTCDDIINSFIYFNEWTSLEQLSGVKTTLNPAPYAGTFEDFLARVERGEPAVAYVWTPTSQFARAEVGTKTMWLSVTNEAALRGAENRFYPGSPDPSLLNDDGSPGFTNVPPASCTQGPDGCQLGWTGSDITAAANTAWLEQNPSARAMLEAIELNATEVSEMFAELEARELEDWDEKIEASWEIARAWVDNNPDRVNDWLYAALVN